MEKGRIETAKTIAALHSDYDPDLLQVILITDANGEDSAPDEPIKLLEINSSTVSAGIMPVYFGASRNIPFPYVIVEITPDEFASLQSKQLTFPDEWVLGETLFSRSCEKASA